MRKGQKSEQYMIAHQELIEREPVDLDVLFKRVDDSEALTEFARVRAESEARMTQIDAETLAFIESENAKDYSGQKKSEQYDIAYSDDPSSGGRR